MKNSLTFWAILPVLLIIAGVSLLTGRVLIKSRTNDQTVDTEAEVITDEPDDEPEPSKEARIVNHYKIIRKVLPDTVTDEFAKILTAQAMHETGNFTSRLYREQNNMFGMRHPQVRETLSTEDRNGYANFATLENSVEDLLLYFKEFNLKPTFKTPSEYVKAIKSKGYFEALYLTYFNAVRSHLSKVKHLVQ